MLRDWQVGVAQLFCQAVFRLIWVDSPAEQGQQVTFVPFLPDGRCVLIEGPGGPGLPAGEVLDDEDYLIDTVLRVPLQTAGFRYQRVRPFGFDGSHLYAWIEGAPYGGDRPHTEAELSFCTAEEAASRLRAGQQPILAAAVTAAAASYRTLDEQAFYADNMRTLEPSYLRGQTPHLLLDCVPQQRRSDLIRHHLASTVRPGTGRVLVSNYSAVACAATDPCSRSGMTWR